MPSPRTVDIVYRYDPAHPSRVTAPRTPAEALQRLVRGNRAFAQLVDPRRKSTRVILLDADDLGQGVEPGVAPEQTPFAAVLGCADARVPVEWVFQQRANDLFRWLRDFGVQFGWRQTGSLTKLQLAANSGGLGVIVARRKEDGRSGHIVMVVPELEKRAVWNGDGEVVSPVQSQAGSVNFRYGTGKAGWWQDERFAEFAFWIHA